MYAVLKVFLILLGILIQVDQCDCSHYSRYYIYRSYYRYRYSSYYYRSYYSSSYYSHYYYYNSNKNSSSTGSGHTAGIAIGSTIAGSILTTIAIIFCKQIYCKGHRRIGPEPQKVIIRAIEVKPIHIYHDRPRGQKISSYNYLNWHRDEDDFGY